MLEIKKMHKFRLLHFYIQISDKTVLLFTQTLKGHYMGNCNVQSFMFIYEFIYISQQNMGPH